MANLTIRNIDETLKRKLRIQAAENGVSMEEAARRILQASLSVEKPVPNKLGDAIRERFQAIGGVDLPEPDREIVREPPDFGK